MSKRLNGEGSIRKRPDGLWEQTIMVGYTPEGKRKRKSFYGKTQKAVKDKVDEFKRQQALGLTIEPDIRFSEWADKWYEGYKGNVSEVTYESYKYTLKILKDELGNRKLKSVKPLDVEHFLKKLREEKSDSMITKCRGMLYQILHKAEANDLIVKNPVRFADKLKKSRQESKKDAFTREEISFLMSNLPKDKIGHTVRLMIGTGLRLQEVVCLRCEHIDEDGGMVRVRNAVEMIKGKSVLNEGHTKTYGSKRDIPVPEFIRESAVYLRGQANPYIWDGKEPGSVYNLRTFRSRYTELLSQFPEVRPLTPHCCRHTYVTLLQSLSIPLEVIAGLTGHTDIKTTKEYLHIQPETAQQVSEAYSKALAGL